MTAVSTIDPRQGAQDSNLFRRVLNSFVDPATFDFWVRLINPLWSWDRSLARVVDLNIEAQGSVTLRLKPNRHFKGFEPGQHINVSAEVNGRRITRCYSLTNGSSKDNTLTITVKQIAGGKLSTHLCEKIAIGSILEIGPAFGSMTLPEPPNGKWIFLAAGSGITPLMALTRSLARQSMPVDLTLIYWARTMPEMCFQNELKTLADSHHNFRLITIATDEPRQADGQFNGILSFDQLQALQIDSLNCNVYACGPSGFVETARNLFASGARTFFAEGFTPPAKLPVSDDEPTSHTVELTKSGIRLAISSHLSILEALEEKGFNPEHGCRMGVCHSCVCTRKSGSTQDMLSGFTDSESGMDLRICINRATSDLKLDL